MDNNKEIVLKVKVPNFDKVSKSVAKFIEKIEPTGSALLQFFNEKITSWRIDNQLRIFDKAQAYLEESNMEIKPLKPKLLFEFVNSCSLEDDDFIQDRWSDLLVNLLDSEKNISSNIFPYVLSQLSRDELDKLYDFIDRRSELIINIDNQMLSISEYFSNKYNKEPLGLFYYELSNDDRELRSKYLGLKRDKASADNISDLYFSDIELANLLRVSILERHYSAEASADSISLDEDNINTSVDVEVDVEVFEKVRISSFGLHFLDACRLHSMDLF